MQGPPKNSLPCPRREGILGAVQEPQALHIRIVTEKAVLHLEARPWPGLTTDQGQLPWWFGRALRHDPQAECKGKLGGLAEAGVAGQERLVPSWVLPLFNIRCKNDVNCTDGSCFELIPRSERGQGLLLARFHAIRGKNRCISQPQDSSCCSCRT